MKLNRTKSICCALALLCLASCKSKDPIAPEPPQDPQLKVTDFAAPEQCATCHPNHYNEWQTSMHAYAFVDPVFFAMNERGQQKTGGALDQFCTQCHSPIASRAGETPPFFNREALSPTSKQGVQCDVCHTITNVNETQNAEFELTPGNTKHGSINNPAPNNYHASAFNLLFDRSVFCGTCHEVVNPLGARVEETFTEWNALSLAGMSFDCQDCHMPTYSGQAAVDGPQREELHRHYFVGADVPLVDFPGSDLQRQLSEELLKSSVHLTVNHASSASAGDTLAIEVRVENKAAGHSLPSGVVAERQMWIAIIARDSGGNVLYQSGQLDANGDLRDHHSELNPNGDPDLVVFRQKLLGETGEEVLFFFEAKSVENNLVEFLETKSGHYRIPVPQNTAGEIHLEATLRFRSLPPYFLRALNLGELVPKVPIVDMARVEERIQITD